MLELRTLRDTLQQEVDCVSELLVRLLHVKDKKAIRITRQHQKLSTILRNYAEENGKRVCILVMQQACMHHGLLLVCRDQLLHVHSRIVLSPAIEST